METSLFSVHGNAKGELKIMNDIRNSDRSPEEKQRVIADMIAMGKQYGFSFSEYKLYGFEYKTLEEKLAFISDKEHLPLCQKLTTPENEKLFESKIDTYYRFRKYYRRDVMLVTKETENSFLTFVEKHPKLFIKPNDDWGGAHARTADLSDYSDANVLLSELQQEYPGGFLAEERMVNAEPVNSLHPGSLNTVRVPTVCLPDGIKIVHPFARIARGSAVVDNAASGGIMGLVDVDTGVITAAGDEADVTYKIHPDTGIPIVGFVIPEWEVAKRLACELAMEIKDMYYCGWDLAYTDRGWVMIEGNAYGQFVWQMVSKKGCRSEFESYVREICGEK